VNNQHSNSNYSCCFALTIPARANPRFVSQAGRLPPSIDLHNIVIKLEIIDEPKVAK